MTMSNKIKPLTPSERKAALANLKGWQKVPKRNAITKQFIFADFAAAFAWMSHIAILAEADNHHPEWANIYNRVDVVLTTHDVKGVSMRDIKLAKLMDRHYKK